MRFVRALTVPETEMGPPRVVPKGEVVSVRGASDARLRSMVDGQYAFIWRQLRRLGLSVEGAEDVAQHVFLVASKRLESVNIGSERAFLFGIARRMASDARKSAAARHEAPARGASDAADTAPHADELVERKRARALLDEALDSMEDDLRTVFVLFELEEMKTSEIADLLAIPVGTVASRLRRSRDEFQEIMKRLNARRRLRRVTT